MTAVLVAERLGVQRGGRQVLDDVTFDVEQGEVFALLGGNGAGKSTTLLTFLGFIVPSSGHALLNGVAVHDDVRAVQRAVAYLPESASLYPHLTALENLDYFLSLAGIRPGRGRIDEALDTVNLAEDARGRRLETYSKGMRQKVGIALAMLRQTPVLLMDEPTSGLDPVAIDEFNTIVVGLARQGTTIVMVTHDVYGACQVAKKIGLLHQGRMVGSFEGSSEGHISVDAVHQQFSAHHR